MSRARTGHFFERSRWDALHGKPRADMFGEGTAENEVAEDEVTQRGLPCSGPHAEAHAHRGTRGRHAGGTASDAVIRRQQRCRRLTTPEDGVQCLGGEFRIGKAGVHALATDGAHDMCGITAEQHTTIMQSLAIEPSRRKGVLIELRVRVQ